MLHCVKCIKISIHVNLVIITTMYKQYLTHHTTAHILASFDLISTRTHLLHHHWSYVNDNYMGSAIFSFSLLLLQLSLASKAQQLQILMFTIDMNSRPIIAQYFTFGVVSFPFPIVTWECDEVSIKVLWRGKTTAYRKFLVMIVNSCIFSRAGLGPMGTFLHPKALFKLALGAQ